MENSQILKLLEQQRDELFDRLNSTSISELHKQQYNGIISGEIHVLGDDKELMLEELKELSKDNSYNKSFKEKIQEYLKLDNSKLISHFREEFVRVLEEIVASKKIDDIQALFIEYDYYYHYSSCIQCYGIQDYPILIEPRYIFEEIDYQKEVLLIPNGINFEPAWADCEEFEELEYLLVSTEFENLFQLHSRVLLHKAIDGLDDDILKPISVKPFFIYINEHDCEQMLLYKMS
jgi:hypothetical protein